MSRTVPPSSSPLAAVPQIEQPQGGGKNAVLFSCVGHFFNHFFEPTFFVVALVLPSVFGISYEAALALIIAGKVLLGVMAPLAGWIADRWSAPGMMAVYFLGMGGAGIACGLVDDPWMLGVALTALGAFASIYHPVGIAWLVRSAQSKGKALGINGIFGSLGPAVAGISAGALIEVFGWRWAFLVPGTAMVLCGLWFITLMRMGKITDHKAPTAAHKYGAPGDTRRAFLVLALGMLVGGLVYQATQAALPKVFDDRLGGLLGQGAIGPGMAVMLVYGFSALMQVTAGHLADRYSLKWVYLLFWLVQAPLLAVAAVASGAPLLVTAMLMVTCNTGSLPAENMLLARYTPERWRATAFGVKFVLNFGMAAVAVPIVGLVRQSTGDFLMLFAGLAVLAACVALYALRLPAQSVDIAHRQPAE
jgi:MFS family permease